MNVKWDEWLGEMRARRRASPEYKRKLEYIRAYRKTEKYRASRRKYMRELRACRRSLHVCVSCGREDAFYSFTRCPACLEREVLNRSRRLEILEASRQK